jgi:hypothetical protein
VNDQGIARATGTDHRSQASRGALGRLRTVVAQSCAVAIVTVASVALGAATPSIASASDSVATASLELSSLAPSAAEVSYSASFTATDGLSSGFSTIDLAAASGTVFTGTGSQTCGTYTVYDYTTGQSNDCTTPTESNSGATVSIVPAITINTGDQVTLIADNVTNDSATGSQTLELSTSSDPTAVGLTYKLSSSGTIGAPNYKQSSYVASNTAVTDTVSFFATDGMTAGSSAGPDFSSVVMAAPMGTNFTGSGSGLCGVYVFHDYTENKSDTCVTATTSNSGATVTIYPYINVHAGDEVTLVATGVTNAGASGTLKISTSSDPITQSVSTAAATSSPASLQLSSYTPSASGTTYQVNFTTSHGLTTGSSTITLAAPTGTAFASTIPGRTFEVVDDDTTSVACASTVSGAGTATVTITSPLTAAIGAEVSVLSADVTNDSATGSQNLTASDSVGDTLGVLSYTLSSTGKISSASFGSSSFAPSATAVTYSASFVATDSLSSGGSSNGYATVTLAAPSGTVFNSTPCDYFVYDETAGMGINCGTPALTNSDATVTLPISFVVGKGDLFAVVAEGVTNNSVTTAQAVNVSTSADPTAQPASYTLSSKGKVLDAALQLSSHAVGATDVAYTVSFQATDGLTSGQSTLTLAAPAGTVFEAGGYQCDVVYTYDHSSGVNTNCATLTSSNGGATLTISMNISAASGDAMTVIADGVTNDAVATTTQKLHVSTSSDPKAGKAKYTLR